MQSTPQQLIEHLEAAPALPAGSAERMSGYGVMGLPFRPGHVLAMRRFTSSSIGPAYTSIWHRRPDGDWVFYTNVSPKQSCPRYFGADAFDAVETRIELEWTGPFGLRIGMPDVPFTWDIHLGTTAATRFMNLMGQVLPDGAWHSPCRTDSGSSPIRARCGWSSRVVHGSQEPTSGRPAPSSLRLAVGTSGSRSAASWQSAGPTSSPSTPRVTRRARQAGTLLRPLRQRRTRHGTSTSPEPCPELLANAVTTLGKPRYRNHPSIGR